MKGAGAGAPKREVVGACPNMLIQLFSFFVQLCNTNRPKEKKVAYEQNKSKERVYN